MDILRAYIWTHASLGPVDCAVQTAHCVGQLSQNIDGNDYFNQWAAKDKTLILLNPGRSRGIRDGHAIIGKAFAGTKCPIGIMQEDDETMESMFTSFGVILPERYINSVKNLELAPNEIYSPFLEEIGIDLASELRSFGKPKDITNALRYIINSPKAI